MSNLTYPPEHERDAQIENGLSTWDELRRLADELELRIHLGSMDARNRWRSIKPRLEALEEQMKDAGRRATSAVVSELEELWHAIQGVRNDVANGSKS